MRIELNSGGLGNNATISGFNSDFSSLISKSRKMVSSFQAVKSFAQNINGGVGTLQSAVDKIDARIGSEETRADALESIQRKANSFIELTRKVDDKVHDLVNHNKHEFYKVNPWSKPPQTEEEKKWYEKAYDAVCEFGETTAETLKNIAKGVVKINQAALDSVSKAWNNAVEWCKENKDFIKQIAIEVAVGVAVIGLAVLTGGTSLAITVAIAAGTGATLGAAGGAIDYYAENGTLKGASKQIIGDAAKGFMTGSISGYVGGQVGIIGKAHHLGRGATTFVGAVSNGVASAGGETIHAVADGNGITEEEKKGIAKSGIKGAIDGGIGAYKGYGKDTNLDKLKHNENFMNKEFDSIKQNAINDMRKGVPNSIYNAQKSIDDLSAFNKYLKKDIIKDEIFEKTMEGIGGNLDEKREDMLNVFV